MKLDDLRRSVKKRRLELGFSTQSVANQAKSTQSNVYNFENGKANITINTLANICEVLGLELIATTNGTAAVLANADNNG